MSPVRCPTWTLRLGALSACALLAGCVTYRAVPPQSPPVQGSEVRATLSSPGALRAEEFFGRLARTIEGQVVAPPSDSLVLLVERFGEFGPQAARVDTLAVPLSEIALIEERRFSPSKTALAVGASSIVIGAVAVGMFRAAGGSGGDEDGDGDRLRVPLLILRLR